MIKGYAAITGDILHPGHIKFLRTCKLLCDWLVVGVMTDEIVQDYKGQKPAMSLRERIAVIEAIKYVDEVVRQPTYYFEGLSRIKPDIVFDSMEHRDKRSIPKGYEKTYVKPTPGISSSEIKRRIIETG